MSLLLASSLAALTACNSPGIDPNTPPPRGVMEGTVLYVGPKPTCIYENGAPVSVVGRVILTLFAFDNPPPPEGSATTALNLLSIPGNELFGDLRTACAPEGAAPAPGQVVTGSASFVWPEIPLGIDGSVAYQVKGFFDADESFNPFFDVTKSPSAGDIAGAAVTNPQAAVPELAAIRFGSEDDFPLGQRVGGVSVSLGRPVQTEVPVFYASSTPMSSEAGLRLGADTTDTEELAMGQGRAELHLYDDLSNAEGSELASALEQMKLDFDIGAPSSRYAWYIRGIDIAGPGGVGGPDGIADNHPSLFNEMVANFKYLFPLVILRRVQSDLERDAGVPNVLMLTVVPQSSTMYGPGYTEGQVAFPTLDVAVPPIGVTLTNPALPDLCRIPYFAPDTSADVFAAAAGKGPMDCQELPTGRYGYNVLSGIAGGTVVADAGSPTGFNITGGQFSSQTWAVPNELGSPAQFFPSGTPAEDIPADCSGDSPCVTAQSIAGTFLVHDPDSDSLLSRRTGDAACATSVNQVGAEVPVAYPDWESPAIAAFVASNTNDQFDEAADVEAACCEPIRHLCDIPVCGVVEDPFVPGHFVRGGPTSVRVDFIDGVERSIPDCVPFPMPTPCCGTVP